MFENIVFLFQAGKFSSMNSRDGLNSKARFGLSLASLGDINKDGYGGKSQIGE